MFLINKSFNRIFYKTSDHCFQLKYKSSIQNIAFSSEKVVLSTTPIPDKLGRLVISDLLILFNYYLFDKSIEKRFPKFSLTNVNVFCKYSCFLFLTAAKHSKKVGSEAKFK